MHYQGNKSTLKPQELLAFIQKEIPNFNDIVDLEDGMYSALGDFAIYLRDGISEKSISDSDLKSAFNVMNTMGAAEDLEVQNLLVVGIFEILTDADNVVAVVKENLEGGASQLFERVLVGWS